MKYRFLLSLCSVGGTTQKAGPRARARGMPHSHFPYGACLYVRINLCIYSRVKEGGTSQKNNEKLCLVFGVEWY